MAVGNIIWRDIIGYEGLYQVSSCGLVRGKPRLFTTPYGKQKEVGGELMFGTNVNQGYRSIVLYKDGDPKRFLIHRLVAIAFIPNPHNKRTINHKNRIRYDNRVENLEWATHSENNLHSYTNPSRKRVRMPGESNPAAALTNKQAADIRKEYSVLKSSRRLATKYGISKTAILFIINNKSYTI